MDNDNIFWDIIRFAIGIFQDIPVDDLDSLSENMIAMYPTTNRDIIGISWEYVARSYGYDDFC